MNDQFELEQHEASAAQEAGSAATRIILVELAKRVPTFSGQNLPDHTGLALVAASVEQVVSFLHFVASMLTSSDAADSLLDAVVTDAIADSKKNMAEFEAERAIKRAREQA